MSIKFYQYEKCGTCRKAKKFLEEHNIQVEALPIRDTPPSEKELTEMLDNYDGNIKRLLNTAGMDYRRKKIKDKLPSMSTQQVVELLSSNGNLVKRPFLIGNGVFLVGFKIADWEEAFLSGKGVC